MTPPVHSLLALAALCGSSLAQTPAQRTPAPPPAMSDVKLPSTLHPLKTTPLATAKPGSSAAVAASHPKPPEALPHARRIPADQLFTTVGADGTQWVRGADYKARFDASGASFIPFFGSRAPQNYPLTFRVAAARVGGSTLPLDAGVPAARDGHALTYQRGSLVERYDVAPQSVEQSFVFQSLPQQGELVLELAVESELAATQDAQGIRFGNELGEVRYGRATVLDAAGHSLELEQQLDGTRLSIRVPASFLAEASFPVTIDPTISVFALDHSLIEDYLPDVAYDPATGNYLTVEEEWYSSSDHDVYTVLTDSFGTIIGGGYADYTTDYWANPRVANNANSSQFMVVGAVGLGGSITIRATSTAASSVVFGTSFQVSGPESGAKLNPDIGGDPTFVPPSYYLVTWERNFSPVDHDIHAALVDPAGTVVGSTILIANSSLTIDTNPRISKCDGQAPFTTSDWTIVWSHEYSTTDHDIYGARVHWNGTITNPTFVIDASTGDDFSMHVSSEQDDHGGQRRYMVTSNRFVLGDWDVLGWVLDGTSVVAASNLSSIENSGFLHQNQGTAAVDCDGSRFAVVYSEQYLSSTTDYDTFLTTFELVGNVLMPSESHATLGYTTDGEFDPSITAAHLIGSPGTFMAVWEYFPVAGGADIDGGLYRTPVATSFCAPGFDAMACPCGNSGFPGRGCENSVGTGGALLAASGTTSPDTLVLSAAGMLPTANAIYLQGSTYLGGGVSFGDGVRCIGGQLLRLGLEHSVAGSSSYPGVGDLPVTARAAALGAPITPGSQRFYQTYYRDPANFACTATFNVTNGLVIDW